MQYLFVNLAVISLPLAFSWHSSIRFIDQWRSFWTACLLVMAGFIVWDWYFTANGVWGFNDAYLVGLSWLGLPLEEWMFFICIPYACVFTFAVIKKRADPTFSNTVRNALVVLGLLSLVVGLSHLSRWYTASATLPCVALIAFLLWRRPTWTGAMLKAMLFLIPAFVFTNGVLTGLEFWQAPILNSNPNLIPDQIVWYDNAQNMGLRLFTIPLEDFFYAFLLIGTNVAVFEYLLGRNRSKISSNT